MHVNDGVLRRSDSGADFAISGLPVLDFRQFEGLPAERAAFLRALGDAARDVGFFYLVGHGIDQVLTNSIVATSRFLRFQNVISLGSRWCSRRISAATRGPVGSVPAAGWTGASRSTSALNGWPCQPVPALRPGRGCKVPTNGRRH
jgi:non-haem dioxygenase in morphine synthesis N-terminal